MEKIFYYPFQYNIIQFNYYFNQQEKLLMVLYTSSNKPWLEKITTQKKYSLAKKKSSFIGKELKKYFHNQQTLNIPFEIIIGTEFQKKVWREISKIPLGKTTSYLSIAKKIHNPKACRAVGSAVGKNPLSIIIPCHRVLHHKKNQVGHYSGGENIKKYLLHHEGVTFKNEN